MRLVEFGVAPMFSDRRSPAAALTICLAANNVATVEKGRGSMKTVYAMLLGGLLLGGAGVAPALGEECDGKYFSAGDAVSARPLARPSKDLAKTLQAAKAGKAAAQRDLAVSYETGYLVSRCEEKAVFWYGKAAKAGDEVAKNWLSRYSAFAAMRAGSECVGARCFSEDAEGQMVAVLYARGERGNHFYAPLTINGMTAEGVVDTGASTVAMSAETARKMGISSSGGTQGLAMTASGTVSTVRVIVPLVEVAGIRLRDVPVSIGITGPPLIGMSFLNRVNLNITSGTLTMTKRQ